MEKAQPLLPAPKNNEDKNDKLDVSAFALIGIALILLAAGVFFVLRNNKSMSDQSSRPTPDDSLKAKSEADQPASASASASASPSTDVTVLQKTDEKIGTGAEAKNGSKVTVNYTGTLTDGTKFDSSYDHGQPFSFNLGAGQVIKGWDQGVLGMKVGGKRKLVIPSDLAYGDNGIPGSIPGKATLVFEVELLKVE